MGKIILISILFGFLISLTGCEGEPPAIPPQPARAAVTTPTTAPSLPLPTSPPTTASAAYISESNSNSNNYMTFEYEENREPRKLIALTFDDGPAIYTPYLLDALKERGARATFFLIGRYAHSRPQTVLRILREGHEIGNHTYNHRNLVMIDYEYARWQMAYTNAILRGITGEYPAIMRPPFGIHNEQTADIARDLGMSLILWSIDPQDWYHRDTDITREHVLARARHGSVILLHDIHKPSVIAAIQIVDELMSLGYEFVTVSELFEYMGHEMVAGAVYREPPRPSEDSAPVCTDDYNEDTAGECYVRQYYEY